MWIEKYDVVMAQLNIEMKQQNILCGIIQPNGVIKGSLITKYIKSDGRKGHCDGTSWHEANIVILKWDPKMAQ